MTARVVVAAVGSEWRGDDGVGPAVVRWVAARLSAADGAGRWAGGCSARARSAGEPALAGPLGDPLDLLGVWDGAELAVVVDATQSGRPPGTVTRLDLDRCPAPAGGPSSTHGIGLAGVLRIARAVGRAPGRVVVVGVEGARFERGTGLSPAVAGAVAGAAAAVLGLVEEVLACA